MNHKSPTTYEFYLKIKLSWYKDDLYTTVLRHVDQAKIGVGCRYIVHKAILEKPLIRTLIYKSNLQLLCEQEVGSSKLCTTVLNKYHFIIIKCLPRF